VVVSCFLEDLCIVCLGIRGWRSIPCTRLSFVAGLIFFVWRRFSRAHKPVEHGWSRTTPTYWLSLWGILRVFVRSPTTMVGSWLLYQLAEAIQMLAACSGLRLLCFLRVFAQFRSCLG
jgi:hypothetical protein